MQRPAKRHDAERPQWGWSTRALLVLTLAMSPAWAQPQAQPATPPATRPAPRLPGGPTEEYELADLALMQLEIPTVITASRHEEKLSAVPYAMSVITQDDIRISGARSVPDALRLVPGMDVADLTYGHTAVSPRGLHGHFSRETLVLIDGRSIFDSLYAGVLWGAWPFQLEDIERIEVIRGPAGVTWGANAVNGVINIITKDPAQQQGLTTVTAAGSRGTVEQYSGYGFKLDKLRLRVSGTWERTDGFETGGGEYYGYIHPLKDNYKAGQGAAHLVYEASPNDTFTLSGGSAVTADSAAPPYAIPTEAARNTGSEASFLLGRWDHRFGPDNQLNATAYINDFGWQTGFKMADYRYQHLAFQLAHRFKPSPAHTLTWGFDSRVDLVDASNSEPSLLTDDHVNNAILGMYVQDEWRFAPRWTLNLGGRIDYDSYGGFEPSARAALAYELSKHSSLYGAVSRSYFMPAAASRKWDMPIYDGFLRGEADPDLHAGTQMSYELGYHGRFFDRFDTHLTLFAADNQGHLGNRTWQDRKWVTHLQLANVADIMSYGLEWEGKWAVTDRLTLLGHYTFQLTDWSGEVGPEGSDQMVAPKNKAMVGVRYRPTQALTLSSHLYFVDTLAYPDIPAYTRLDIRGEYEFWKDRGSVAVGVRNLIDPHHPEATTFFLTNAEVPRMVYAEVRLRFK